MSRLESDISRIIAKVGISRRLNFPTIKFQIFWAVYKSGTGTRGRGRGRGCGDACVGTLVWGRETRDLRTSSMGRGDVWDGDTGTLNQGCRGCRDDNDY